MRTSTKAKRSHVVSVKHVFSFKEMRSHFKNSPAHRWAAWSHCWPCRQRFRTSHTFCSNMSLEWWPWHCWLRSSESQARNLSSVSECVMTFKGLNLLQRVNVSQEDRHSTRIIDKYSTKWDQRESQLNISAWNGSNYTEKRNANTPTIRVMLNWKA